MPKNFEQLKTALDDTQYVLSINKNAETRKQFFLLLTNIQITYLQTLELINTTGNKLIKSLLITHLLGQKDYLANLQGGSILTGMNHSESHIPSRLNALIHQLDVKNLSLEQIETLQPETAVSILCSVPHLHLLTREQVHALLRRYPYPVVISYWLRHIASMPNAYCTLAHLIAAADSHVVAVLKKMDANKREAIIEDMISHLELFNPKHKLLYADNEEQHLVMAIELYLNHHQHEHYVIYIHQLIELLFRKNYVFSQQTVQLLLSLNDKPEFKELTGKTHYLINSYLRAKAQAGEIDLFYNQGRLKINSMTQSIQLNPLSSEIKQETSLLGSWFNVTTTQEDTAPEHPLIMQLVQHKKTIHSFDYFLIHYKGTQENLNKIVSDYLRYYNQEGCTASRRLMLHHTAILMTRTDLDLSITNAIYNAFLNYPDLYDELIIYRLFLYNAPKTVQHFGLQGGEKNYDLVISLCDEALKKLDPHTQKTLINIAIKAKQEAELELSFLHESGLFTPLWQRIKRCWIYGWNSFFTPNPPLYVSADSVQILATAEGSATEAPNVLENTKELSLNSLLKEIETECSLQKLNELIGYLNANPFKAFVANERLFRQKINTLFHELLLESQQNKSIHDWLMQNETPFVANRIHLLALLLRQGSYKELDTLIMQIKKDSTHLSFIVNEFTKILPELNSVTKETILPSVDTAKLLETATGFANNAWQWTANSVTSVWSLFSAPENNQSKTPNQTGTNKIQPNQ